MLLLRCISKLHPLFFAPAIRTHYCHLPLLVGLRSKLFRSHISVDHVCRSHLVVAPQHLCFGCVSEKYAWSGPQFRLSILYANPFGTPKLSHSMRVINMRPSQPCERSSTLNSI